MGSRGAAAGYTFDLASWTRTTITGLIPRTIVLTSPWSQTYRPGHHNFSEDFIFDPRLEPGISPAILQDLAMRNIAFVLVRGIGVSPVQIIPMTDACMPCPADWNSTGAVTIEDLFIFLGSWFGGDLRADWDGSGVLGVQDIFEFVEAYFVGCT